MRAPLAVVSACLSDDGPVTATVDTTYSLPTGGTTYTPANSAALTTALASANAGDVIVLDHTVTYVAPPYILRNITGTGWVYIISDDFVSSPPKNPGFRVAPADNAHMAKITCTAATQGCFQASNTAHHYRLVGIEMCPVAGESPFSLVSLSVNGGAGSYVNSVANCSHHIILDRCYIHGNDGDDGPQHAVHLSGLNNAVINCDARNVKWYGADSQAIWILHGTGPFLVQDNYLEASGENILIGGANLVAPQNANMYPCDIIIRSNKFEKRASWIASSYTVKNHLEFKDGQRVLVEGNYFLRSWVQSGGQYYSIVFTPRNDNGHNIDLRVRYNKCETVNGAFVVSGDDYLYATFPSQSVHVHDNLFLVQFPPTSYSGSERGCAIFPRNTGPIDFVMDHNTIVWPNGPTSTSCMLLDVGVQQGDATITNNLMDGASFGVIGTGQTEGTNSLNHFFGSYSFSKNVVIGRPSGSYPSGNFFPANVAAVGFTNFAGGDYSLTSGSAYHNAGVDGKDVGANISCITAALAKQTL